jgi:hypothetical protein
MTQRQKSPAGQDQALAQVDDRGGWCRCREADRPALVSDHESHLTLGLATASVEVLSPEDKNVAKLRSYERAYRPERIDADRSETAYQRARETKSDKNTKAVIDTDTSRLRWHNGTVRYVEIRIRRCAAGAAVDLAAVIHHPLRGIVGHNAAAKRVNTRAYKMKLIDEVV